MKKILYILIIVIMFLMTFVQNVYAEEGRVNTKILDESFIDEFRIDGNDGESAKMASTVIGKITPIVNKVLSVIQFFGVILSVLSIAIFGFSIIMSNSSEFLKPLEIKGGLLRGSKKTPSDQKQLRQWMWVVLIGSLLLFCGSTVVKIVFKVLQV